MEVINSPVLLSIHTLGYEAFYWLHIKLYTVPVHNPYFFFVKDVKSLLK